MTRGIYAKYQYKSCYYLYEFPRIYICVARVNQTLHNVRYINYIILNLGN